MYWLLSCIPLFIQIGIQIIPEVSKSSLNFNFGVYMVINLLIIPIYLLIISWIYIRKMTISYTLSIICMLSVVLLNVLVLLVSHKMKHGVFIGDVPEGIYYLLIIVPSVIVLIGVAIFYLIKHKTM